MALLPKLAATKAATAVALGPVPEVFEAMPLTVAKPPVAFGTWHAQDVPVVGVPTAVQIAPSKLTKGVKPMVVSAHAGACRPTSDSTALASTVRVNPWRRW